MKKRMHNTKILIDVQNETKSKSGMYGELPTIKIGKYTIAEMSDSGDCKYIWIQDTDTDEGGEFKKDTLYPTLEKFFNSNF